MQIAKLTGALSTTETKISSSVLSLNELPSDEICIKKSTVDKTKTFDTISNTTNL